MVERRFPFSKPPSSPGIDSAGPVNVNVKNRLRLLSEICIHISDTPWALVCRVRVPCAEILGDSRARSVKPSCGREQPVANSVPNTQPAQPQGVVLLTQ
jgi:hypothetical protein